MKWNAEILSGSLFQFDTHQEKPMLIAYFPTLYGVSKMKRITLSALVLMLAACGGKNTDDYVGTWQREGVEFLQFAEIKKTVAITYFHKKNKTILFLKRMGNWC